MDELEQYEEGEEWEDASSDDDDLYSQVAVSDQNEGAVDIDVQAEAHVERAIEDDFRRD